MDMNTVTDLIRTAEPDQWRPGDAWLAGGTVLFSFGSTVLQRLLDITVAGWEPLVCTEDGLDIAATCTVAQLYAFPGAPDTAPDTAPGTPPAPENIPAEWTAVELFRPCCDSFVASFKIWNVSTVGGNICTALPAGPLISLTSALDGTARILSPGGGQRFLPVAELVTGDARTALADGELLRSIFLPASALRARTAFRRLSLSNLGRSGVLLIGRLDEDGGFVLTVTAATVRPVQLRFAALPAPAELDAALDTAIAPELWHDDVHGLPRWRRDMTYLLAAEIRAELEGGTP